MKQKEIYENVAAELGMSPEKVKFVIEQYEAALRWYISNPYYAGKEIIINGLCRYRIYNKRLYDSIVKKLNLNKDSISGNYLLKFANKFIYPDFLNTIKEKLNNNEIVK